MGKSYLLSYIHFDQQNRTVQFIRYNAIEVLPGKLDESELNR